MRMRLGTQLLGKHSFFGKHHWQGQNMKDEDSELCSLENSVRDLRENVSQLVECVLGALGLTIGILRI